ncbi:5' nucleotidase, NT5C type [Desulfosporosinus nitroreducens]|uniref:5' nucleotidase, deoxy (Pyrimidine), type C protein (NT5C) n=1 Tax=Desulfosporosinus nitroreducens TaxID=2018668 RepID=A0ABT8QUD5_9FIRM|nr:hypothetical protein [Desulfosporosinus nitroreducens]MDO0824059.1 hypothetical protein [Desulfosporosinus nitroreducens]
MVEKQRLLIDMDGTLAVFTPVDELETLYEPGYFLNLKPINNVVQSIKEIIKNNPDIEVNILSAYLPDSPYALEEKNAWLDQYLPEVDLEHRIFPPCGSDKKDYLPGGIRETDFLLDDYTHNLKLWQPPARGIKLLNGINYTRGTWEYDRIRYDKEPQELAEDIVNIMRGREQIYDERPYALISEGIKRHQETWEDGLRFVTPKEDQDVFWNKRSVVVNEEIEADDEWENAP